MSLFEVVEGSLKPVPQASFTAEGVRELYEIQQWVRTNPSVLGERLLVISEEFGNWEDSKRRIDLLAIDEDANLVVVELKRTDDGGHMELQAIRYAAMISAMTFEDVVDAHERYLTKHEPVKKDEAKVRILKFLGEEEEERVEVSTTPRIILLSADFSLEITTTVLWLITQGLNLRCLQMVPYKVGERMLLDLRQVIPLAQAGEYQVRLRQKEEASRQATTNARRELTLKVLLRHGIIQPGTEIEVVPDARPDGWNDKDPNFFRARVGDPHVRAAFTWLHDGKSYSLTQLSITAGEEGALKWLMNNIYIHWRIVGHELTMWDEAEQLARSPASAE